MKHNRIIRREFSNQAPQSSEQVELRKRISEIWNSRSRIAGVMILVTSGVVLHSCCVIVPPVHSSGTPWADTSAGTSHQEASLYGITGQKPGCAVFVLQNQTTNSFVDFPKDTFSYGLLAVTGRHGLGAAPGILPNRTSYIAGAGLQPQYLLERREGGAAAYGLGIPARRSQGRDLNNAMIVVDPACHHEGTIRRH